MLKITNGDSTKVTYMETPSEIKERLQEAKDKNKKKSKSVLSKLVGFLKSPKK